jgi:beta-glucosidase
MTIGMTWDGNLLEEFGEKMASEFYNKGANVLLGPGLNLHRVPVNGRDFEYLSGADPYLGYVLVQSVVKGIQSQRVIANAKHFIENNQEDHRDTISANVDERTRFELYYQPFIGAIESGVGSFMCSYNKINGAWSCENNATLNHDLRDVLGYKNWVMSDWEATHSLSISKGLDQEMPVTINIIIVIIIITIIIRVRITLARNCSTVSPKAK